VREELQQAISRQIDEDRVLVLPLLMERCELPPIMAGRKYADFTTPTRFDASLEQVLRTITGGSDRGLPVFRNRSGSQRGVRLLGAGALLVVLSTGLSQVWKAPPQFVWESPPRTTTNALGNTEFTREIRPLGSATVTDTLVWRFAISNGRQCRGTEINKPIAAPDVDWPEGPAFDQDEDTPQNLDLRFDVLPRKVTWRLGVTVTGVVPRECLHLERRDTGNGQVEVSRLPLPLARLRTNQFMLGATIFLAGLLLGGIVNLVFTLARWIPRRRGQ
jgi:hypothetical protein